MNAVPGGGTQLEPTPSGAVRRTTTILITPRGRWAAGQTVTAKGRDLARDHNDDVRTSHDGFSFDIDPMGLILPNDGDRGVPVELWGQHAQRGLRKNVAHLRSAQPGDGHQLLGPVHGLYDAMLDDVVGATLASGYGRLHEAPHAQTSTFASLMQLNCVGFSTMHERGEEFDTQRYFANKPPNIEFVPDEALAWHDDDPMRPNSFRRRRMLQVAPTAEGSVSVTGYFRDTFMTGNGDEKVVHEYGLNATVSGPTFTVDSIEATPGSLPLDHCPLAAPTALTLRGLDLSQVDATVRHDIAGPSACTHLNDELRSLRLVPTLLTLNRPEVRSARTHH